MEDEIVSASVSAGVQQPQGPLNDYSATTRAAPPRAMRGKKGQVMIRAKIWFRCAAMHDPVMPVMVRPAVIGWKGLNRQIDLTIEREFKGAELVRRMKGWITVDPERAITVLEAHGRLKCFDNGELVVEVEDEASLAALERDLAEHFRDQCNVDPIPKGS